MRFSQRENASQPVPPTLNTPKPQIDRRSKKRSRPQVILFDRIDSDAFSLREKRILPIDLHRIPPLWQRLLLHHKGQPPTDRHPQAHKPYGLPKIALQPIPGKNSTL
jgi:hypothetical protein